jgi:hypothetical protein
MTGVTRRLISATASAAALTGPSLAQARRPQSPANRSDSAGELVDFPSLNSGQVKLRAFSGQRNILLIAPERLVDQDSIARILAALDKAWDWFLGFFPGDPLADRVHAGGRFTVAEVAMPAFNSKYVGIELASDTMTRLLSEAKRDRYNQACFYIMGRIFWRFEAPLGKIPAFESGFAHAHRFHAMEAAGLTGAPWDEGLDFDNYKRSVLLGVLEAYLADSSLTWQNTIAAGMAPTTKHGWGAGELAAGFFHRIRRDHGNAGYRRFWRVMADAAPAGTAREAASRFIQVARAATGADYRALFRDQSLPTVY